nr:MAG TPA: hypothetical protein [Microviridae sp. ctOX110]
MAAFFCIGSERHVVPCRLLTLSLPIGGNTYEKH